MKHLPKPDPPPHILDWSARMSIEGRSQIARSQEINERIHVARINRSLAA